MVPLLAERLNRARRPRRLLRTREEVLHRLQLEFPTALIGKVPPAVPRRFAAVRQIRMRRTALQDARKFPAVARLPVLKPLKEFLPRQFANGSVPGPRTRLLPAKLPGGRPSRIPSPVSG